jgi:hypothetical protein
MRVISLAALVVTCAVWGTASAADFADTAALTAESAELQRMKLAELRYHLRRRGIDECGDCVEKEHFRQRLRDELAAGTEVSRTHDEAVELAAAGKRKSQKAKAPTPEPTAAPGSQMSEEDIESLRETFAKKQEENDRMREALRKAGIDPSSVKTDADMFGDILKNAGKGAKKGKNGKRARPPPKPTPEEVVEDL